MRSTTLVVLGYTFVAGMDDQGTQYVAIPDVEKALKLGADSARKKLASKSWKAAQGKDIQLGKNKIEYLNQKYSAITIDTFLAFVDFLADQGNVEAKAFNKVLRQEAFVRRIDEAFGINKPADRYEGESRRMYDLQRSVAKRSFRPSYTDHLKADNLTNYPKEVQRLKVSVGLAGGLKVDNMTLEEVQLWVQAQECYDMARMCGKSHNEALVILSKKYVTLPIFEFMTEEEE